ncbi:MAG TPA: L-threonylcarbamoyladenylate synthase [Acidobacteriota bacterium]|nr:L-threonylcarbamoyladenylate synthase [Acidobacteriota bacterium]
MKVVTKNEYEQHRDGYLSQIKSGAIFIYPTDTIYGLGCNALIGKSVKKVRDIKQRPSTPFSVIAPSVEWIREFCIVPAQAEEWLSKLPGPYTFIFKMKEQGFLSSEVSSDGQTIGVRIPNHWIRQVVADLGYPIVTTSVNEKGKSFMTSLEDLDANIQKQVNLILYDGEKKGKPSQIIHFEGEDVTIVSR